MIKLDEMTSLGHVMAKGQALSLYFYAEFEGEVLPWGRVKLHDAGKFCHCYSCKERCVFCQANRKHPAHNIDEQGSRTYNNKYGPYLSETDPTNGPIRPEDPRRIA